MLPPGILETVDLNAPATTVALLGLDAVVGVKGTVQDDQLVSVGITCALCHSTVDDSVMPGIGNRIDGPANRELNPGAILALSPFFDEPTKAILNSWGCRALRSTVHHRWHQHAHFDPTDLRAARRGARNVHR